MTRWTVRKAEDIHWDEHYNLCSGPRWCVTSPTGVSWGNYATHAEALERADREARTLLVTLPRQLLPLELPGPAGDEPLTVASDEDGGVSFVEQMTGDMVRLCKHELLPVALALLAHAEQGDNE